MNLAIVITASTYRAPLPHLPACKRDAELVSALLEADINYDDKLIMTDIPSSAEIKARLSEFVARHHGEDVDRVFVYFSGHGDFTGDEFFYLLPDYNAKQRRQTSLENSEIDRLLRGLKPKLAVKMIDACHSGVPYIKDTDAFGKYLKGTQEEFQKCYFMFSSQADQSSYQSDESSFFTRSFAEAIAKHPTDSIRLKDIIDYVSDTFAGNSLQTPFFVIQADFTEPFCKVTDALRSRLSTLLFGKGIIPVAQSTGPQPGPGLKALIAAEAYQYCTEEEAIAILERLDKIVAHLCRDAEGVELYEVACTMEKDYSGLPEILSIANWLDKNKNDLFVEVFSSYNVVEFEDPYASLMARPGITIPKQVKRVRSITGIRPTVALPYNYLAVTTVPKYPNIQSTACFIVPLISETEIRLFVGFGRYDKKGWKDRVLTGQIKWKSASAKLKDGTAIEGLFKTWLQEFWSFTLSPIKERFGLLGHDQAQNEEADKAPLHAQKPERESKDEVKPSAKSREQESGSDALRPPASPSPLKE